MVLRGLALPLIVDETADTDGDLLILGGDHRYDVTARAYRERPSRRILLIQTYADRLVQNAILPSDERISCDELAARGVPRQAIVIIPGATRTLWESARQLQNWMSGQSTSIRIVVLCDRFSSRQVRYVFQQTLTPSSFARLAVQGLADRRYDEWNWWQARSGTKQLLLRWIALIHGCACGEDESRPEPWNPDEYDEMVASQTRSVCSPRGNEPHSVQTATLPTE